MNRFMTGLVTGSVLAAVGVSFLMTDNRQRKRVIKDGRRAMRKAGDFIGDII